MQQTFSWGLLGAFVYLVQLLAFDGDAEYRHGSTRLHEASLRGTSEEQYTNIANIEFFIFNKTPLTMVSGKVEEVMEQIDDCDDIDVVNQYGNSALHNAVRKGHTKVVRLLLENGADLKIRNAKGKTPIDLAYGNNEKIYANQT